MTPDPGPAGVDRAVAEIEALLRQRRRSSMAWWRECDLSIAQLHLLATLNERGPTTVGALADALAISAPSASSIVDRLVERGTVDRVRSTEDRRQVLVSLSEAGRRLADEMQGLSQTTLRAVLQQLEAGDLADLLRLLPRLAAAAARTGAPTPAGPGRLQP